MPAQSDEPHADLNGPNGVTPAVADAIPPVDDTNIQDQTPQRSQTATSEHAGLLEVFKANLIQAGHYRPATDDSDGRASPSHDDVTLMCVLPPHFFRESCKANLMST